MWQKRPDGRKRKWKAAKRYCRNLTLAGYSDWELPSKNVLKDMRGKKDMFDQYKMDDWDSWYWSNDVYDTFSAWDVSFSYGHVNFNYKTNSSYVRCVRGGQ